MTDLTPNNAADLLAFPAHLDARGRPKRRKQRDVILWSRIPPAVRPEGERWLTAGRWEITIGSKVHHGDHNVPNLAGGCRRVWVVEGRKWCRLHDGLLQCKISMEQWGKIARASKQVEIAP